MLRTAGLLALPRRALSAGFDGGLSPPFQCVAAQLLGGWDLTETRLALASPLELIWTHLKRALRQGATAVSRPLPYPGAASRSGAAAGKGRRWRELLSGRRPHSL